MMKTKSTPRSGFTLIELLTVIAIIGILAAILIPTVGAVKKKASMVTSSSNMKQIAVSYTTFSNSGTRTKTITNKGAWSETDNTQTTDQKGWAQVLAYNAGLTDAGLYFISSDEDVTDAANALPRSIGIKSGSTISFTDEWNSLIADTISYVFVVNMSSNAQGSTPLLWTKGLGKDGTWELASPWQGEGGHIAFMDGHVEFFNNLTDDESKLAPGTLSGSTTSTSDITVAIQTTSTTTSIPAVE